MAQTRLKTPEGQRRDAPGDDIKVRSEKPPIALVQNIEEMFYSAFRKYCTENGNGKKTLKRWHELANVERHAWRAVVKFAGAIFQDADKVAVAKPPPDQIAVLISDGNASTWGVMDRKDFVRSKVCKEAMAAMLAEIDRQYAENPDEKRPGEDSNDGA